VKEEEVVISSIIQKAAKIVDFLVAHHINNGVQNFTQLNIVLKNFIEVGLTKPMIYNAINRSVLKNIIEKDQNKLRIKDGVDTAPYEHVSAKETELFEYMRIKKEFDKNKGKKIKGKKVEGGKPKIIENNKVFTDEPPSVKIVPNNKNVFIDYVSIFEMTTEDGSKISIRTNGLIEVMTDKNGQTKIIVSPIDNN
jgi:hypothetical protein